MIKAYLVSPLAMQAPRVDRGFRLYVAAQYHVIGAMLTQEDDGKEYSVAYISRRLVDAEVRYTFIEKYAYPCIMPALNVVVIY
jgi:hypothetical protein